jgi:hypothetical protein
MPDHFEVLVLEQVLDIATRTGEKIVDADDDGSIGEQALTEMRAEETGTASNQCAFFEVHLISPAVLDPIGDGTI